MDQLVANVWESCNGCKLISLVVDKAFLCDWLPLIKEKLLFSPISRADTLKEMLYQHDKCFGINMLVFRDLHKKLCLEIQVHKNQKTLFSPKHVWSLTTCPI